MNKKWNLFLLIILLGFSGCGKDGLNLKVKKEIVDGVFHLINPVEPMKGKIILDIEKIREIDPYQTAEFDLSWLDFKRNTDGEVMLFEPTGSEIHRFGPDDKYLGKLTKQGQGPGEFLNGQFLNPFYVNHQLYVTGGMKLSRFEKNGNLIDERKIGKRPQVFVDENRFFTRETERRGADWTVKIVLINMDTQPAEDFHETVFFQRENVGMVQNASGDGYTNPWGIPDILFAFDNSSQQAFFCLNSEYMIYVKNLSGKTEFVIEKPYKNVPVTEGDKRDILAWQREPPKWVIDTFPDHLVAIKSLKKLPNGYLAAYRVAGIDSYEIDIFNPDGHFVYSVAPLESIDLDEVKFYGFGFARIKTKDDGFMIYEEYRIKNLPDIFKE